MAKKIILLVEYNPDDELQKKRWQAKSDIDDVIRRRKGEPDKRISRMSKKL
jgi:hypothetical protein